MTERIYIVHPRLVDPQFIDWGNRTRNFERYLRFVWLATSQGLLVLSWAHHELLCRQHYTDPNLEVQEKELIRLADHAWLCGPRILPEVQRELQICLEFKIPVQESPSWVDPNFWPSVSG